jgi:hypothetical protein
MFLRISVPRLVLSLFCFVLFLPSLARAQAGNGELTARSAIRAGLSSPARKSRSPKKVPISSTNPKPTKMAFINGLVSNPAGITLAVGKGRLPAL